MRCGQNVMNAIGSRLACRNLTALARLREPESLRNSGYAMGIPRRAAVKNPMSAIIIVRKSRADAFMIFAALVGVMLGFSKLSTPVALLILTAALLAKVVVDLRWDRTPIMGSRSPYIVYCQNLERAGESIDQAWLSYAMQLLFFGGLLGAGIFALARAFT